MYIGNRGPLQYTYIYISKSDWTKPGYRHSCQNKRDAKAMSIVNQVR